MTLTEGAPLPSAEDRAADLVLARLHLRLGQYGLARAELETMAGRNLLDDEGIRDLAEVRWRTGDLPGAGDAALAYLELRPDDALALAITAEVQAHLGRPAEARRLAGRAVANHEGSLETIFAGMPRSSVWPVEPGSPVEPAGTLFADLAAPPARAPGTERVDTPHPEPEEAPAAAVDSPGFWGLDIETLAPVLPDPGELLSRARAALDGGRPGQAAAGIALALRAEPSLAPAVLDMIAGRSEPVLALVRGDAHTIVGHEAEALRDYVAAVDAIDAQRRSDDRRARKAQEAAELAAAEAAAAREAAAAAEYPDEPDDHDQAKETS
jgi:hypothetical protein